MSALKDSEVVVVTRAEYEADLTKMAREGSLAACAALLAAFGAETDAGRVVQSMIETIETIEAKGKK